jgi:hypothetical protein
VNFSTTSLTHLFNLLINTSERASISSIYTDAA